MKGLRITLEDATQAVETLSITHTPPKGVPAEKLARVWVDALQGIEPGELRVAVKRFIRDGDRFFPKPSSIRDIALAYRREVAASRPDDPTWEQRQEGSCPVCGAKLRLLTAAEQGLPEKRPDGSAYPTRYGVLHDELQHRRANVPVVGYSTLNVRQGAA